MKKYFYLPLLALLICISYISYSAPGDTLVVKTFSFDSISNRRAIFKFPTSDYTYGKILMYYTLKCDSATTADKYPCGEWDYTTYTRIYKQKSAAVKEKKQPSFRVGTASPKNYYYTKKTTWSKYYYFRNENKINDYYLHFDGSDYFKIPSQALNSVSEEITVSFWYLGDISQPRADAVFEATDKYGDRIINLHIPYDNGVMYFDAGGRGQGNNDNINVELSPLYYKGVWTHYAVSKNSTSGIQKIYRNGKLLVESDSKYKEMAGITSFIVGCRSNKSEQFLQGSIDDFMIWNKELSRNEIRNAMYPDAWELPAINNLLVWYPVVSHDSDIITDKSGNGFHAKAWGMPEIKQFGITPGAFIKPQPGQQMIVDSIPNSRVSITLFGDSLNPTLATDTIFAFPGYNYLYAVNGALIDSVLLDDAALLQRRTWVYSMPPTTTEEIFEIGRFITPYGKRLDLGLNGFTWVYDVTDYLPLLQGNVDLQAGNGQELIDLRFLFIEGTPERDVIRVSNVYPFGSHTYLELADDKELEKTMLRFSQNTKQAVLRARISGHGHAGPFNCCEWDPKTHMFVINGDTLFSWKVWRDCGMNPLYPQGGTWQFDRAGWCPGTFVDTYDFAIPDSVIQHNIMMADYAIEDFNPDNGEEKGNFEISIQLLEFGAANFQNDAAVDAIFAPSDQHEYRRMNPISTNPVIRIKNTGTDPLTQLNIKYGLENGKKAFLQWEGNLNYGETEIVTLPTPSWKKIKEGAIFMVEIKRPNGRKDQNILNNSMIAISPQPLFMPEKFVVEVKTQDLGRADDNSFVITNAEGTQVAARLDFPDDSLVLDTISLSRGSYVFEFFDKNEDGMIRHWWNYNDDKSQVGINGSLRLLSLEGEEIMDLHYDWAEVRRLRFFVGKPF